MKNFYHATTQSNFEKIQESGEIKVGFDSIVYLAESPEDAYKFIGLRVWDEPIVILEITGLDPDKVIETFDHSYAFFKCRSFGYLENIPTDNIASARIITRAENPDI